MSQYESFHLWGEGRFCYDDEKVNKSKDLIKDAEKALDSTKENIAKGFSSLLDAANIENSGLAENIRSNEPVITKFPEDCVSYIEELYKMVQSKQDEIEKYKNAGKWDKFWSTVGMAGSKILEGIASVGENIIDAGATLVGCVGGILSSDFQDSCAEFIKKDHVGEAFHNFNEATGLTKYSAMSENGTAAKIFKGIGVATGYVAAAAFTGGALGVTSTTANTIVAAAGGLGSGMESGLQEGKDWNSAFGGAVKQAAIQGGTAFAMGKLSEKVQTNRAMKANNGQNQKIVEKASENVSKSAEKVADARKAYRLDRTFENKQALRNAKDTLKGARNAQQFVEKQSIAGENLTKAALKHTTSDDFFYNLGDKASKLGRSVDDKVISKLPIVKTVDAGAERLGNFVVDNGTKVTNGIDKAVNKFAITSKADKFVVDKATAIVDKGAAIVNKIPGSQTIATKAADIALKHPKIASVASTISPVNVAKGVVKSPGITMSIGNEVKAMDNNVIAVHNRQIEAVDKAAEEYIGNYPDYSGITGDDISNIMGGTTQNGTYTPVNGSEYVNHSSGTSYSSTSDSGYTAYQPSVTARQVSSSGGGYTSSGGGYTSSGGGSTYTPTYTATASSPSIQTADVATTTNPLSDRTYTTTNLSNTTPSSSTSSGSTGNSSAVMGTINNSTGGSTSGGNTSTYTYDEPVRSTTSYSSSGTTHSGGGYSSSGYSFGGSDVGSYSDTATSIDPTDLITEDTSMSSTSGILASSITSTNKFSNQTIKIPTSSEAVTSSSSNMAIPTAAAFSAAAAAGIGAKAFLDKKQREKEESDEVFGEGSENSEIYSDNWEGSEDDIKVDYGAEEDEILDDDNSYSADSIIEKYEAVSNEELEEA